MKKSRILFIIPPLIPIEELTSSYGTTMQWATNCSIPMGVLSLAAYVGKYADVDMRILDLTVEIARHMSDKSNPLKWEDFLRDRLMLLGKEFSPDILGISAIFNSNAGYLQPLATMAKSIWPNVLVTAGGGLPTNMYQVVLEAAPAIDGLCLGEGEKPLLGLIKADDRMKFLAKASGWMTRERAQAGMPLTMDLVIDLDEIPFLRYDLIDFEQYQKLNRYHGERTGLTRVASIMTSRGCPYFCNFCASHSVHGRQLRYHSAERINEDIRKLKELYGVQIILIEDDNFIVNKKKAFEVLGRIAQEKLTIEFPNGLSIMHLDEDLTDAMKAAGLKCATLAVETGNERVLNEIINKPYKKLSAVKNAVSLLRRKGIYIRAFFIIGFPGETKAEIGDSINFMKDTGFNWVAVMIASPIAGSKLYQQCKDENLLISDRLENFHYGKANIRLSHSTPEAIEKLRYQINLQVNFVENYDMKIGRPELALIGFQDVINRVPNHAFAYYYASLCYQAMGNTDMERQYLTMYQNILASSSEWKEYAQRYNLPLEKGCYHTS